MSRKFIKINSASNDDGNEMFNAICKDVIKTKTSVVRADLGLPVAQRVTTKDLITLIQENKLDCEITVFYKDAVEEKPEDPAEDIFK